MEKTRVVIQNHHLGIDLGTTSVKTVIWDAESQYVACEAVENTNASKPDLSAEKDEQDVKCILNAVQRCLQRLPAVQLRNVESVGVCGQMHGVVLWKSQTLAHFESGTYHLAEGSVSPLITWQDGRCSADFLAALPAPKSHIRLSSGFGCVTLFWLAKNSPQTLEGYDCAGTVQDLLVAMICGLDKPVMTTQNAAGWGYFDTASKRWNLDVLTAAGFPVRLLPEVEGPRYKAGRTKEAWCGITAGTVVGAAFGDLQCCVHSVLNSSPAATKQAVLNISTSAQLSFVMNSGFKPSLNEGDPVSAIYYWPYFGDTYLAIAASLNGGNVMARWISMFSDVFRLVGVECSEEELWTRLLRAASSDQAMNNAAVVSPLLFGERHSPNARGSVANLKPDSLDAPSLTRAICRGIVANLHSMMPTSVLQAASIVKILGTGSALVRNEALQAEVKSQYALPFVLRQSGDAAAGAAKAISEHP